MLWPEGNFSLLPPTIRRMVAHTAISSQYHFEPRVTFLRYHEKRAFWDLLQRTLRGRCGEARIQQQEIPSASLENESKRSALGVSAPEVCCEPIKRAHSCLLPVNMLVAGKLPRDDAASEFGIHSRVRRLIYARV